MIELPSTETLQLRVDAGVLYVTFARPERKNALSPKMLDELLATFGAARGQTELRAIVLRGGGGTFCAGADLKEMSKSHAASTDDPHAVAARGNRRFGDLCMAVQEATQPVIAVVEGAVLGGGFGVVCASDIALCRDDASFGLPETGLGLIPAQIAPFVVQRIGLTQARRLMLTGARFDGARALALGLVHEAHASTEQLDASLVRVLSEIKRCAPRANAKTKALLLRSLGRELGDVLDDAANVFAEAALADEAREGTQAFLEKRAPKWSV
jgi:isohexenylglutaconyl-CoA hydratase